MSGSQQPPIPPGGLPPGVVVKHWGSSRPPSLKSRPQGRLRPFGMKDTPYDPMSGKFLGMAAPGHENDSENEIIAHYLEEHLGDLINSYLSIHLVDLFPYIPGFDENAVQHLTNVNGTIQWVTTQECEE